MIILHMFLLIFNVKKVADFLYHRPEMLRNITCGKIFNCLFLLHGNTSRFVLRIKNPCDFSCLYRLVLRTDFNHNYLIFGRFHLKNRTTTKPTLKPLIFSVSAPVAIVTMFFSNPMANDGNSTCPISQTGTNKSGNFFTPDTTRD